MKKLLLASVFAIASFPGYAQAQSAISTYRFFGGVPFVGGVDRAHMCRTGHRSFCRPPGTRVSTQERLKDCQRAGILHECQVILGRERPWR